MCVNFLLLKDLTIQNVFVKQIINRIQFMNCILLFPEKKTLSALNMSLKHAALLHSLFAVSTKLVPDYDSNQGILKGSERIRIGAVFHFLCQRYAGFLSQ